MSSVFANQFNYANAYNPVGLDTGTPQVGATLGKRPPREKTPSEEEPSRVPTSRPQNVSTEANATAGLGRATVMGLGAGAAVGAGLGASQNSNATRLSRMAINNDAANNQSVSSGLGSNVTMPSQSGAQVNHPAPSGFWGSLGHDIASGADAVGHFLNSGAVHDVMNFGDPFHGAGGGLNGALNRPAGASDVVKPSAVYNPSRSPSGEVTSGSPNIIQGSVENPGNVGAGTFRAALGRGTGYDNMNLGPQFYSKPASTVSRLSASASDTPWYDSIPSDLSSLGEDVLAGL